MKTFSIVILFMNVVTSFAAVSDWTSVKEVDAAIARTKKDLKRNLRRLEEYERNLQEQEQKELELMKMIEEGYKKDLTVLEELDRISRSSTRDLQDLKQHLEQNSLEALREAQNELDKEKEKEALLQKRLLQAKKQVQQAKHEHMAVYLAPLRQAGTADKVVEAALNEAASLQNLRRQLDLRTEEVLARKKKMNEGTLKRWRRVLYSLFSWEPITTNEHVDTAKDTGPAQVDMPQEGTLHLEDYIGDSQVPAEEGSKDSDVSVVEESEDHVREDSEYLITEECEGPAPRDLIWRVYTYLYLAISLIISAITILYVRLWVKRRRNHH